MAFAAGDCDGADRAFGDFSSAFHIYNAVDFRGVGFGAEGVGFGVFVPAVADGVHCAADRSIPIERYTHHVFARL